jgi:Ni,Fe-hydrogenase I small subunit
VYATCKKKLHGAVTKVCKMWGKTAYWKCAKKQHHEQKNEVEVVGPRGPEHGLVGYVGGHDGPAPDIHDDCQLDQVDGREPRSHKETHPNHALIVHQVKNVFGYL